MKSKNYLYIIGLSVMTIGGVSCNKYLDRLPLDTITSEAFFENATQVEQALTGVYNAFGARTVSPGLNNPTPYYSKMDLYTELGLERGLNGTIGSGAYNPTNGAKSKECDGSCRICEGRRGSEGIEGFGLLAPDSVLG
ncbi:MAG: hypothetical protein MUE71_10145 [Chitinophagaceae bacterium]|nr:hypothetical protein [Chitinophagaceae bacterium]